MSVMAAITDIYGPLMVGRSIFDLEAIHESFDLRLAGNPAARAALDIALHDAMGKAKHLPVHALIGGCCQPRIPLEWSVSLADDVGKIVAEASRAVNEFGIQVLCIKAADRRGWRQDVRHFEAVRREVGDDIVIGVDPNTGWSVADSIAALRALRHFDLGYLEQPVARHDLAGMAAVRRAAECVPLMADESLFTPQDAYALAKAEAADALCIKLYKVGGLTSARRIAAVADATNLQLNVGGLCVQ
jgi:L-alanine-DL-glutamate epimerase-like enolase superfamily enzyme